MTQSEIQSLRPSQLVQFMIDGLRAGHTKVDMDLFGSFDPEENICYGCAATNAMCEMTGKKFTGAEIQGFWERSKVYNLEETFLCNLENAYDALRRGGIYGANQELRGNNMCRLPTPQTPLPHLTISNYLDYLPAYQAYADYCRSLESTPATTDL